MPRGASDTHGLPASLVRSVPPPLVWREYTGPGPVDHTPALIAFYDDARDGAFTYEVGYPEPCGGWTNSYGVFITGVWAWAPIFPAYGSDMKKAPPAEASGTH